MLQLMVITSTGVMQRFLSRALTTEQSVCELGLACQPKVANTAPDGAYKHCLADQHATVSQSCSVSYDSNVQSNFVHYCTESCYQLAGHSVTGTRLRATVTVTPRIVTVSSFSRALSLLFIIAELCKMLGIRSISARNCALPLRYSSSATRSQNPSNELRSVQAALVCSLFHNLVKRRVKAGTSRRLMCVQEEALEGVNYIRQSAHQVFWCSCCGLKQTVLQQNHESADRHSWKQSLGQEALVKST